MDRLPRREQLGSRLEDPSLIFEAADRGLLGDLPVADAGAGSGVVVDVVRPCLRLTLLLRGVLVGLRTLLLLCFLWLLLLVARFFVTAELARFRVLGVLPLRCDEEARFFSGVTGSAEGVRLGLAMP